PPPEAAPPPAFPPHAVITTARVKTPINRAKGVACNLIGLRSPYVALTLGHRRAVDYWHACHRVRLQPWQHLTRESTNLLHEQRMRHRAAIQADRDLVRAGVIGGADDAFGNLVGRAPRQLLGQLAQTLHGHAAVALA